MSSPTSSVRSQAKAVLARRRYQHIRARNALPGRLTSSLRSFPSPVWGSCPPRCFPEAGVALNQSQVFT